MYVCVCVCDRMILIANKHEGDIRITAQWANMREHIDTRVIVASAKNNNNNKSNAHITGIENYFYVILSFNKMCVR